MPVTASNLFDFLAERATCSIERHEISSAAFSDLRRSLRFMIVALTEGGDWEAKEVADRLRSVISEWLTAPVLFNDAVLCVLREMGDPSAIEARWGRDILSHFKNACRTGQELVSRQNPVRAALSHSIQTLREQRRSFRIFCHRRSRGHFDSLPCEFGIAALPEDVFIHSVAQYRESEPFDVLLKVGPLRSRGWGSAPDALITAPRFDTLIQVVWSGCSDEPGFGYDPVSATHSVGKTVHDTDTVMDRSNQLKWKVQETQSRDSSTIGCHDNSLDVNEFEVFEKLARPLEFQRAKLVQVDEDHGVLYPPHSRVLGMDTEPRNADFLLPGETLLPGMFLIIPVIEDTRLAGLHAEEGDFSRKWKERLKAEYDRDVGDLANRLWDAGLQLLGLHARIEQWCRPATTVIHAPQQKRHFEVLIKVLGLDFDARQHTHRSRTALWQFAWDEIRRARGEAIQTGFQEQQIIDEQLLRVLHALDTEVRTNLDQKRFQIPIPPSQSLRGVFRFYRVLAVEDGFQAPPGELKMLCELRRIDQWRA